MIFWLRYTYMDFTSKHKRHSIHRVSNKNIQTYETYVNFLVAVDSYYHKCYKSHAGSKKENRALFEKVKSFDYSDVLIVFIFSY